MSSAASFFASGLKGRYKEDSYDDHQALDQTYRMVVPKDGRVAEEDVPLRNAMNEVLRDAYVEDCQRGVDRWNKRLTEAGIPARLRLPLTQVGARPARQQSARYSSPARKPRSRPRSSEPAST